MTHIGGRRAGRPAIAHFPFPIVHLSEPVAQMPALSEPGAEATGPKVGGIGGPECAWAVGRYRDSGR
jgi:hypothetical protein